MARTLTQIRQLTAQLLGLVYVSGTADSGGSTTTLKDSLLESYEDDTLIGYHIYLTSGSPSLTELVISDSVKSTGVVTTFPTLGAAPDTLTYEVLPFSATAFLRAAQEAVNELYDRGLLVRPLIHRIIAGSPLYNSDWSYWTSSTAVDGWALNGSGTLARERASANVLDADTAIRISGTADYFRPNGVWKRWLTDFRGQTVTLYCWARTATASAARLNLYTGSNNYSSYHSGSAEGTVGVPELLSVEVSVSKTATDLEPRLYNDTTANVYFGQPWLDAGLTIYQYPFPSFILPDGPDSVRVGNPIVKKDDIASGRGLGRLRHLGLRGSTVSTVIERHRDEATTTDYSVLTPLRSPANSSVMLLKGSGPLTVPTATGDNIEVTESESQLMACLMAMKLLEKGMANIPAGGRPLYREKMVYLRQRFDALAEGVGSAREAASLPLTW